MNAPSALPAYAGDLVAAPLMGLGMAQVESSRLTLPQLEAAVGAIVTLLDVGYAWARSDPVRTDPTQLITALVAKAPADYQARYDAAIKSAEGAATAAADAVIDPAAKRVPIIGGILAAAGNAIAAKLLAAAGARLTPS